MNEQELLSLIHQLIRLGYASDSYENDEYCHFCFGESAWIRTGTGIADGEWHARHKDDCPYVKACELLTTHHE